MRFMVRIKKIISNAYIGHETTFYDFYKSSLMSTARTEINLVKVQDSKQEIKLKEDSIEKKNKQNELKLRRIKGV